MGSIQRASRMSRESKQQRIRTCLTPCSRRRRSSSFQKARHSSSLVFSKTNSRKNLPESSPLPNKSHNQTALPSSIHKQSNQLRKKPTSSRFRRKSPILHQNQISDMEDPFFSNYWNAPRPRSRFSPNPIHQQHHPPKVVSIPVRFVGSEKTRSEAATKIQKLYRGFAVRKNVKKIAKIRSQVDNVQHQISQKSDLIARDAKERLRLNETLMSLLFQLDSVRGVDPAVRDCRKAVIRRAIALQEAIDAIVEKEETETAADSVDQTLEKRGIPVECVAQPKREMQNPVESEAADEQASEIRDPDKETVDDVPETETENPVDQCSEAEDQTLEAEAEAEAVQQDPSESLAVGVVDDQALEIESSDRKSVVESLNEDDEKGIIIEKEEEDALHSVEEDVAEENEKLRGLVLDLCERNTEQSRLIELLSQRVDQLEKTVARCERIRKKKQKRCAGMLEREIQRRKCERWL